MAIGKQLSDGNSQGTAHGQSATDLISFYGATPVAQRASAIQATSAMSANASVAASLQAWVTEVTATLNALGLWKGGA